jgi:hypothetical protein
LSQNSTCFEHLLCPLSGVIRCTHGNWYVSCRLCGRCLGSRGYSVRGCQLLSFNVTAYQKLKKFDLLNSYAWLTVNSWSGTWVDSGVDRDSAEPAAWRTGGPGGHQTYKMLKFCWFFQIEFIYSDKRQYSEGSRSNFTNNYGGRDGPELSSCESPIGYRRRCRRRIHTKPSGGSQAQFTLL